MKFTNISRNSLKNYYITTPIFYVNSVPHIGHLYTVLLADANARWNKIKYNNGPDVFLATGTDEHGYKIQQKAILEKQDCKQYCDKISAKFRDLFKAFNINYNDFIRTTENRHKLAVNHMWSDLYKKNFIYKSKYEGWYSINDECFLKDDEIEETKDNYGNIVKTSKQSGHKVEFITESNYMFRLKDFKKRLKEYLDKNIIIPESYYEALHNQLETLEDLSVSRESKRISWGIPVPHDGSQVIYVWLDALVNYLTLAGYPNDMNKFKKLWPPDVHVIGKDILRFHAIYWPAILIAANLELPKKILCHGHWLVNNKKMSKSLGNVIDPFDCLKKYTLDGMRYFLLREGVPDSDCNISVDKFTKFINAELANTLGNLYSRVIPFNKDSVYYTFKEIDQFLNKSDISLINNLNKAREECDHHFSKFNFYNGIQVIMSNLRMANNLVQEYKPWTLIKSQNQVDQNNLKKMIFLVYESLRISSILLQPIVPNISKELLDRLNVNDCERFYENAILDKNLTTNKSIQIIQTPLFKRL